MWQWRSCQVKPSTVFLVLNASCFYQKKKKRSTSHIDVLVFPNGLVRTLGMSSNCCLPELTFTREKRCNIQNMHYQNTRLIKSWRSNHMSFVKANKCWSHWCTIAIQPVGGSKAETRPSDQSGIHTRVLACTHTLYNTCQSVTNNNSLGSVTSTEIYHQKHLHLVLS